MNWKNDLKIHAKVNNILLIVTKLRAAVQLFINNLRQGFLPISFTLFYQNEKVNPPITLMRCDGYW